MKPAADSISESAPKPTSAIEPAATPAPIATAASIACQPTPSHASARARRTSAGRSACCGTGSVVSSVAMAVRALAADVDLGGGRAEPAAVVCHVKGNRALRPVGVLDVAVEALARLGLLAVRALERLELDRARPGDLAREALRPGPIDHLSVLARAAAGQDERDEDQSGAAPHGYGRTTLKRTRLGRDALPAASVATSVAR